MTFHPLLETALTDFYSATDTEMNRQFRKSRVTLEAMITTTATLAIYETFTGAFQRVDSLFHYADVISRPKTTDQTKDHQQIGKTTKDQENQDGIERSKEEEPNKAPETVPTKDSQDAIPYTYTHNHPTESSLLVLSRHFHRQYLSTYPTRRDLFLLARNEHGMTKFVCTYLKPSRSEFMDGVEVCQWVASAIERVSMKPPQLLPKTLASPTATLKSRKGTAFEITLLTLSFLLGMGFDAYFVSGG